MTPSTDEPSGSRALWSLSKLGRDAVEQPSRAELDRGLNALFARIAGSSIRRRASVRWSVMAAAAALSLLVGLFAAKRTTAPLPPLAYQIEGGSIHEGGYLRGSGHGNIQLTFNEGTRFVLMPGTRGRLRAVERDGVRLAIENGTASFQVTKSNERRWLVEVGPFLVTVKGTQFTVAWDPSSERFELRLREGRVMVSGPVTGGDLTLRAGQRLVVNLPKAETLITEDQPDQVSSGTPAAPASSSPPPNAVEDAAEDPVSPSPSAVPTPSNVGKVKLERNLADELANGQWDRIVENVERNGVQASLNAATSEELSSIANAARYLRRTDLARAALLTQRRRFPASPRALDAIYLLGRVEESSASGLSRAITWYDEYLSRAPMGAYAAEALGRKMTITSTTGGRAEARAIAEEYLRRFPSGSYAGSARALLRAPPN